MSNAIDRAGANRQWAAEKPAVWDSEKVRIVGGAPVGVFDRRFQALQLGELVPGEWWRVLENGKTVGYGWLDVVWGDAEILLASDPAASGRGIGTFIVDQLAREAQERGLNRLYNIVRPTHPEREKVSAWLQGRGFRVSDDGTLVRELGR